MRTSTKKGLGPLEWFLLIVLSVLWGGSFFFSKVALNELHPFTIVLVRVGIAAITLNMIAIFAGKRIPSSPKIWGLYFIMGALNNLILFSLIFWGQTQITSGLASMDGRLFQVLRPKIHHLFSKQMFDDYNI